MIIHNHNIVNCLSNCRRMSWCRAVAIPRKRALITRRFEVVSIRLGGTDEGGAQHRRVARASRTHEVEVVADDGLDVAPAPRGAVQEQGWADLDLTYAEVTVAAGGAARAIFEEPRHGFPRT